MTAEAGERRTSPLLALTVFAAVAVLGFAADYTTKSMVLSRLDLGRPVSLVGDVLRLSLAFNTGAAFSFASGLTWVFSLIALGVVVFVVWTARRLRSIPWAVAFGLLLAGTLGNLSDRLFPKPGAPQELGFGHGAVVDFLQLKYFAIFNVADVWISSSVCLAVLLILLSVSFEGRRRQKPEDAESDEAEA